MIAALYVLPDGPYADLPDVEPWALPDRDAREYPGPWPIVAHPPCARWGRYYSGGPSAPGRYRLGDDGGCFAAAITAVRRWGGVLEHPEASHAWAAHGLAAPPRWGGWIVADGWPPNGSQPVGWTCCVEQGHYGHPARKATWLYAVGCELPTLIWGRSSATGAIDLGFHSTAERRAAVAGRINRCGRPEPWSWLTPRDRQLTPAAFRDVLIGMARTALRGK